MAPSKRKPPASFRSLVLVLSLMGVVAPARSAETPSVSLGGGQSSIVEFDDQFRPLRTYLGLLRPSDVTPLADGTILVVDEGAAEVLVFDTAGGVVWRQRFEPGLQRARPRPGGGLVLTLADKIVLTDAARNAVRTVPLPGVRVAVELPNGNLLAAYNEGQGWLGEIAPDGTVVWLSRPQTRLASDGRWEREPAEQTFVSIVSLDVRRDGAIFTSDFDAHTLRLLSEDYQVLRSWSLAAGHFWDTRFGPSGELIAVAPESRSVFLEWADGRTQSWTSQTTSTPLCAAISPTGTIWMGLLFRPENELMNATLRRSAPRPSRALHRSLPGAMVLGAAVALLVGLVVRWPELRSRLRRSSRVQEPVVSDAPPPDGPSAALHDRTGWSSQRTIALAAAGVTVLGASVIAAWKVGTALRGSPTSQALLWFALSCVAAAVALRVLVALAGMSGTLSSFSPCRSVGPDRREDRRRTILLVVLALSSLAGCLFGIRYHPDAQALSVGSWVAAQILLLAAAFTGRSPATSPASPRWRAWWIPGLLVLGAALLRFWDLGHFPDFVHWDHGIYGTTGLRFLRGDWSPFFATDGYLPRPWVAVWAALLRVFGTHYWVVRVTGAVSGVLLVLGTYLLGNSLFNRRVGACAAFLAMVNHVLLLYSRQPYVQDPAPWFVFTLYFASVGLKRGSRVHWCLSGLSAGWMMFTYWSATALALVGASIFACFAIVYPRWVWRHRMGIVWLLVGALVVYLPMLPAMTGPSNLSDRIRDTFAVFDPDGTLRSDAGFWKRQLGLTFGTVLSHGDHSPWGVSTGLPIVIGPEAAMFGTGLAYLLVFGRAACAIPIFLWIGIGFLVGNGFFADPQVLYHCLGSIPPILLASGIAIDRFLTLSDAWTSSLRRMAPRLAVTILLAFIASLHLRAVWQVVGRRAGDDRPILRADLRSIVPRYIREHPDYRYYLVRSSTGLSCAEPSFLFFADDSDVSDVTGEVSAILPVPPTVHAVGAAFVVLPEQASQAGAIRATYATARREELLSDGGSVDVYLVDAETVRRTYEAVTATAPD